MLDNLMPHVIQARDGTASNGLGGLAMGLIGGTVTIAQVAATRFDPGTFFGVVFGCAAGVGGLGWWIYCFPQNQAVKDVARLTAKIEAIEASHAAKIDALEGNYHARIRAGEDERTALFKQGQALAGELARLKARFNAAVTPDPDTGEFDTRPK